MFHFARASAVLMLSLVVSSTSAQKGETDATLAEAADAYLKTEVSSARVPGMAVCVVRRGNVVLARGYGFANMELSVPASAHTIFELASLTKPFTAVAIMTLAEEGRISLEDRLPKYFAGAPASWTNVSVEHLLRHTSGFGDFFAVPELRSRSDFAWEREIELTDLVPILFRVPIPSEPGEKWSYSNLGYYLLGLIIEKVTGEPYEDVLKHRILEPLHMTETRRMSRSTVIAQRASGYTWQDQVLRNATYTSTTWAYSEGGLVSSAADLAKADQGFFGEKLLTRRTLERMWQQSRLKDGTVANYGLGWNVGSDPRRRQVYHSGNKPGFSAIIRHYLDESLTVVVLANVDNASVAGGDVGAISYHVSDTFLRSTPPR
jgi:D-alanyl-D-alanine carboxypeptidase